MPSYSQVPSPSNASGGGGHWTDVSVGIDLDWKEDRECSSPIQPFNLNRGRLDGAASGDRTAQNFGRPLLVLPLNSSAVQTYWFPAIWYTLHSLHSSTGPGLSQGST